MKIAIIGAGITGLYLGWKLSERGEDVVIFEKKEKIGKEVCSGLFSERILEFVPESKNLIKNKIDYCLIHFPRRTLKIRFSKKFFVMSHYELDNLVADFTKRAGAKIDLSQFFHTLPEGFDKIIGCDGAMSIVRKSLGLPEPNFLLSIQGFLIEEKNSNFVETWPTTSGFIWKIPRGDETEYGIIEKPEKAKEIFEEFLRNKKISLGRIKSAIIPQGLIIPKNQRITLCGDALGLTKPWSGGGVIWSLTAATLLLKNFSNFLKYKNAVEKFFLPQITISKIAKNLVYFLGFKIPWIIPKELKIDGDFLI
jgi:flavin-dependent dehydrogenase